MNAATNTETLRATATQAVAIYTIGGDRRTSVGHPADLYVQLDLLIDIYPSFHLVSIREVVSG